MTHLPGQEKCSQTLGCLSWRPLQSYMPVVFFGLAGTLLDLLNGKCSSRMAGWEGSIKPAAEPAALPQAAVPHSNPTLCACTRLPPSSPCCRL